MKSQEKKKRIKFYIIAGEKSELRWANSLLQGQDLLLTLKGRIGNYDSFLHVYSLENTHFMQPCELLTFTGVVFIEEKWREAKGKFKLKEGKGWIEIDY